MESTSQLQKVNDELEGFAYSVSHDLRAPLRHIDGFLSLMYANIEQDSEVIDGYYQKISEASKRMAVMIDALLRFSRLGRANLKLEPVNIHQLINEIINQEKIKYQQRKILWKVNDLPIVPGDYELLRIAFENIIHNSIKYTTNKPEAIIEVGICTKIRKKVCIFFKDNGISFNMNYKEKLFGVFQTLHSSDDYDGVGIGLAISNQIITKHNGTIDAISELDEGAIFYVTLPLIDLE
jgi:light-regulated signal transduction histidine kinase (bacteriophytochrome)